MVQLCPINIEEINLLRGKGKWKALAMYHEWLNKQRNQDKKELRSVYQKKYNHKMKALRKDYSQEYKTKNKEKIRNYCKLYYQKNKDKIYEYQKSYREENKEKLLAYARERYAKLKGNQKNAPKGKKE